jgi:hypothetical protein
MRNRVPHLSLLTQFSILSLLCVVVLGAALVLVTRDQIHDRAAADSRVTAQSIANDIADQHVTARDLERGLSKDKLDAVDRSIETLVLRGRIRTAKIYDPQGKIVYSFDHREIGRKDPGEEVQAALEGHTQAAFEGAADAPAAMGRVYEVYVPLHLIGDREPSGVFEVLMPYAPIAAQIDQDSRSSRARRASCAGTPRRAITRRCTTTSPASPTAASSCAGSSTRSRAPQRPTGASPC